MKKSSPTQGNIQLERDAGDSSTQESDHVNTKSRQKRRPARDEKDDFLVLKNEIREWLRAFQRDQNARLDKLQDQQNSRLDAMEGRIAELSAKLTTANNTSQDIGKSVDFVSEKIFELQGKIDSFKKDWTAISAQISDLEDKQEALARAMNKTCIEIRNVPKQTPTPTKSELFGFIRKLCSGLNIEIHSGDIRDVSRFTSRKDNMCWNLTVELSNTLIKNNILSATRKYNVGNTANKLNASHLGLGGNKAIYISEYLTPKAKRIYFLAREFAKSEQYEYCWSANGNVYLRKKNGFPYILIKNEDHLNSLSKA